MSTIDTAVIGTDSREELYAALNPPTTLTLRRRLPGPVERVWAHLTDSGLRAQWLAAGDMALVPGAPFELVWRNDELSASPAERPEGFPAESRATCRITQVEPLRRLSFEWPGVGDVTFQLAPAGDDVLLTVTHERVPDPALRTMVGAGWHMHLDILQARAEGRTPPSFWRGWVRLRSEYERRLAA
jgi:uncharacterized protein YndB with AHSA1/START domain